MDLAAIDRVMAESSARLVDLAGCGETPKFMELLRETLTTLEELTTVNQKTGAN